MYAFVSGNHTNNYVEANFRLLKDTVFERQKRYNVIQLIEALTSKYPQAVSDRVLTISQGRAQLKKFSADTSSLQSCSIYQVRNKHFECLPVSLAIQN